MSDNADIVRVIVAMTEEQFEPLREHVETLLRSRTIWWVSEYIRLYYTRPPKESENRHR